MRARILAPAGRKAALGERAASAAPRCARGRRRCSPLRHAIAGGRAVASCRPAGQAQRTCPLLRSQVPPGCSRYTVSLKKPLGLTLEQDVASGNYYVVRPQSAHCSPPPRPWPRAGLSALLPGNHTAHRRRR
jgi:hypothetical protein